MSESIVAIVYAITELGFLSVAMLNLLRRAQSGETVSDAELAAAKADNHAALSAWEAAGQHDRPSIDPAKPLTVPPLNIDLSKKET